MKRYIVKGLADKIILTAFGFVSGALFMHERDQAPVRQAPPVPAARPVPIIDPVPGPLPARQDNRGWDPAEELGAVSEVEPPQKPNIGPDGLPQDNGVLMTAMLVGEMPECPVPGPILRALDSVEGARNKAFLAAIAWRESRWDPTVVGDGGQSKGAWQLHRYWGERTAKYAEQNGMTDEARAIRAGWTADPSANLAACRALMQVQKAWHPGGYRAMAAYYNDGGAWKDKKAQAYASAVLSKMDELLPFFS